MNRHYIHTSLMLSLVSGALLFSCTNQNEPGSCSECEEIPAAMPYSVGFSLEGSVNGAPVGRAAQITQTEKEKKLTSLYAVVFVDKDGSESITTGTPNKEDANDLFFAAFPVDLTGYNQSPASNPNLQFSLGEQGHYNICFIANPSGHVEGGKGLTGLAKKITSLTPGSSKVSDFKALMEDVEANLDASLLMTSPFYFVTSSYTKEAVIEKVTMTRAVARVDVVNKADGITVKKMIFHNFGNKSKLISDGSTFTDGTVISETFTPDGDGLVGNAEGGEEGTHVYKEKIYTYEQYAGVGDNAPASNDKRPALEIVYCMPDSDTPDKLYSHTVKFENNVKGKEVTPVPLKRNNHYRVTLANKNGNIQFALSVKDWDKAEDFQLEGSDFAQGTQKPKP